MFLTLNKGVDFMVVGKLIFFAPNPKSGRKKGLPNFRFPFAPRACRDIPQLTNFDGLDSGGPELFFFMILLGL